MTCQAQADLSRQLDNTRFTEAQIAIAIVVSIIGTLALSVAGAMCFFNYRDRRDTKSRRQLKDLIMRPDTGSSSGSGDVMWDEIYTKRPAMRRPPRNPLRPPMAQTAPPRGPPRVRVPQPPETIKEEMEPEAPPVSSASTSPGPVFSLFPRVAPGSSRETLSPGQVASPRNPFGYSDLKF